VWARVAESAFGKSLAELVKARVFATSRAFAAVAVTGTPSFPESEPESLGGLVLAAGVATIRGRPVRWDADIRPGDCLLDGHHYTVLMEDDGNGVLDRDDTVIHCWKRPPAKITLGTVFPDESIRLQIVRYGS